MISIIIASDNILYLNYVKTILNQYLNDYRIFSLFETEFDNLQQVDHKKINVDEFTLFKFFNESYEMSESQYIFFLLDPLTINKNLIKKILNYVNKRKKNPEKFYSESGFFNSFIINREFVELDIKNRITFHDFKNSLFLKNKFNESITFDMSFLNNKLDEIYLNKHKIVNLFSFSDYVITPSPKYSKSIFFIFFNFINYIIKFSIFFYIFVLKIQKKSYRNYLLNKLL